MRRRLAAAVGIALLAVSVAVTGCSPGDTPSTGGTTTSPTANAPAVQYMDKVCSAVSSLAGVSRTAPPLDPSNPEKMKSDMTAYMAQWADALNRTVEQLRSVGPSPVPGGDQAVNRMTETFSQLAASFTEAKTKLEQADPNDPRGGLQAAGEAIAKVPAASDALREVRSVPELRTAAEQAPKCQELGSRVDLTTPSPAPTT